MESKSGPAYSKIVFRDPASLPKISESPPSAASEESADPMRSKLLWKLWDLEANRS